MKKVIYPEWGLNVALSGHIHLNLAGLKVS